MKNLYKLFFTALIIFFFSPVVVLAEPILDINGKAAITVDVTTGEILYAKNMDEKMYPASTTKLMTALLLAQYFKPDELLTYSQAASKQISFSVTKDIIHLPVKDKISASDAMDALLLCSGNDIAYMIAENVGGGSVNYFISLMNKKVEELGLHNTHFVTVNGLHDVDHYSTAYDLSKIAGQLYKYPWIMNTLLKKESKLTTSSGVVAKLENTNKLLSDPGCVGGKTGYTSQALRCLVTFYEISGRKIVGVILKSDTDDKDTLVFSDMKKIIDWSYGAPKTILIKKYSTQTKLSLSYHLLPFNLGPQRNIEIPLFTNKDFSVYKSEDKYELSYQLKKISPWEIKEHISLGKVTIKSRETNNSLELYSAFNSINLFLINLFFYIKCFFIFIFLVILFLIIRLTIKKVGKQ